MGYRTPYSQLVALHAKFDGRCAFCGWAIELAEMRENALIPVIDGGADDFTNRVPACKFCARVKGRGDLRAMRARLSELFSRVARSFPIMALERHGIVTLHSEDLGQTVFYFEKIYSKKVEDDPDYV